MDRSQLALVRELNDCYRRDVGWDYSVQALSARNPATRKARRILSKVWQRIRTYQEFSFDDFEHNCGEFDVDGVKVTWEIDYLDRWSDGPSANPADARVTQRTITLTLELVDGD